MANMANIGVETLYAIIDNEYAIRGELLDEFIDTLLDNYDNNKVIYCLRTFANENNIELELFEEEEEEAEEVAEPVAEPEPVAEQVIFEEPIVKSNIKFSKTTKFNDMDVEKMIYTSINDRTYNLYEIRQNIANFSKLKMKNMLNKFEEVCEKLLKTKARQIEIFKINGLYY